MPYDPDKHHRRSIRLPGYDYTVPGAPVWQRNDHEHIGLTAMEQACAHFAGWLGKLRILSPLT